MFKTDVQDVSFGAWMGQQIGAVLVPAVWALSTANVPASIERKLGHPLGSIAEAIWYALFVWGIGFIWALLVHRFFSQIAAEGRWVWPLPTFFFLLWFVFLAVGRSFPYALAAFFDAGQGEEGWLLAIVTYPTCQCVLYSFGMFLASRKTRQRGLSVSSSPSSVES
jgi:hypothetical protein